MADWHESLEALLQRSLPPSELDEARRLLRKSEKERLRLKFSIERLQKDKGLVEGFLSATIEDLEAANEQLKEYQRRELEEKEKTIRYQESQLRQITDAMPSSMAFVDKDFRYQINNKSYLDWFGRGRGDLKGVHVREIVGDKRFQKTRILMEKAMAGERQEFEIALTNQYGEPLVLHVIYIPSYDHEGNSIGVYVYAQDVTALKEKEQAIASKNKELQRYIESNMQLENFAYLASHDLRSPLTNVLNFANLLNKSAVERLTGMELKFLDYIIQGGNRMKGFMEDLLDYSLSTNKEVEFSPVNVDMLVREILEDISSLLEGKNATVCLEDLPLKMEADRFLLNQLFQNLIGNAVKFVREGESPRVLIKQRERKNDYLFFVKDNGIGIDGESKERIFGIFKRLHLSNEYEGTGIGLSTCRNAVEKHGGSIWVESELGKGSTFYFTIPKILRSIK